MEAAMAGELILVVDDEANVRDIVTYFLEAEGYRVTATGDPDEALVQAREEKPDLALLDIMMPRMDGFDLCQMIRDHAETREIPVIFLSALGDPVSRMRGRVSGAVTHLQKPFRKQAVLEAVRFALESRPKKAPLERVRGAGRARS